MSPVLRPFNTNIKKVEEVKVTTKKEDSSVETFPHAPTVPPVSELIISSETVISEVIPNVEKESNVSSPEEKVLQGEIPKEVKAPSVIEEAIKDEKISAALQEILNRKIEKAIVSAEAIIEAEKVVPTPTLQVTTPPVVEVAEVAPLVREIVPMKQMPEIMNQVQIIPPHIITTLPGQEIRIPKPQGEISSIITIPEKLEEVPVPSVTTSPLQNVNVIPVHIAVPEVASAPLPLPPVVEQSIFSPRPIEDTPPKVHWFDKLFGSTPKTPPQAV
jgi:hypothetical protein